METYCAHRAIDMPAASAWPFRRNGWSAFRAGRPQCKSSTAAPFSVLTSSACRCCRRIRQYRAGITRSSIRE